MEEVDSISVAVSNIDINKVEPLENRRVAAFINHFLCTTVTFLNQFATKCECKLDQIQQKLFKIESALRILESKLESLPQVQLVSSPQSAPSTEESTANAPTNSTLAETSPPENVGVSIDNESKLKIPNPAEDIEQRSSDADDNDGMDKPTKQSLKEDPRYAKYFKMMYLGVPVPAIKLKMKSEGVDPAILDG